MQLVSLRSDIQNSKASTGYTRPKIDPGTKLTKTLLDTYTLVRKRSLITIYARHSQDDEVFNDRFLKYKQALLKYVEISNAIDNTGDSELLTKRSKRLIEIYRELSFEHEKFETELCSIEALMANDYRTKINVLNTYPLAVEYN